MAGKPRIKKYHITKICKCGCNESFLTPDKYGKERDFINGHQNRGRPGLRGENNPKWKGRKQEGEYFLIYRPDHPYARKDGYILEHRVILENKLGRLLLPVEISHHKDNNKQNNDPDNLELKSTVGEHTTEHNHKRKGTYKLSPQARKNISQALMGNKSRTGMKKPHTEETKAKMRLAWIKRKERKNENRIYPISLPKSDF